MKIGTITNMRPNQVETVFDRIADFDLHYTQLTNWYVELATEENAKTVVRLAQEKNVKVCALWAGYSAYCGWNFYEGPMTLGLVPQHLRRRRLADLKRNADFAKAIGAPAIITHCGFLPENMTDPNYEPVVEAVSEIAEYCKNLGLGFWFETGQETPVVLLRVIEAINTGNLGINLDSANLLMYGKGNPCDALKVFGKYVRNLHVKDGMPPTDGQHLGQEVQVGEGLVNYPKLLPELKALGFDGEFIIEREIQEDENQKKQILATAENLRRWWDA